MSSEVAGLERAVGEVPTGWRVAPFSDLADYVNGRAFKPEDWGTTGLPIIRIAQITNPDAETNFYDGTVDPRNLIDSGDLIFSWSATLAVMRWVKGAAVLNQHLFKVTPAKGIDRDWLQFRLEASIPDLADEAHGTTMKHIRKGTLSSQSTVVPPLDEQRRIAVVLRSVDEAIAATQEVVKQAQSKLEAAISAFLGNAGSNADWKQGRCDGFFVLQRGFDITEAQASPGPYRVISSSGPAYTHCDCAVEGPAVITGRKGRLGTVFYSNDACWPHDTTLWVKDFKGNHPRFVYWKLRQMNLKAYDAATSVPTLNRNNVHALEITFPPIAEQIDLSATLDAMLLAIEQEESQLSALQALKASVSNDLLSGRVRVPA